MSHKSPKFILEQIYNFVVEMPEINSKSHFIQLKMFFSALHEADPIAFDAVKPSSYKGIFNGKVQTIFATTAPNFFNKKDFLDWAFKKIDS